ncbi:hypothetical protein [Terriglobus sp. RCC_193]|uniref:hypothetical protein n=1 Tax=Terriglobus sp. RCC_193 TaxID=3239218 RepID=UPI0035266395
MRRSADTTKKEPASEKVADTSEQRGWLYGVAFLLRPGLILPFYELFTSLGSGALGLLILFWGMQYAWNVLAKPTVDLDGPFAMTVL